MLGGYTMYIDNLVLALTRIQSGATYIMEDRRVPTQLIQIRRYGETSYRILTVDKATNKTLLTKTAPLKEVVDTIFRNER